MSLRGSSLLYVLLKNIAGLTLRPSQQESTEAPKNLKGSNRKPQSYFFLVCFSESQNTECPVHEACLKRFYIFPGKLLQYQTNLAFVAEQTCKSFANLTCLFWLREQLEAISLLAAYCSRWIMPLILEEITGENVAWNFIRSPTKTPESKGGQLREIF